MSGKKGMKGGGGARPGAGRKPKPTGVISDRVKANIIKAAEELAIEYGETIEKAALRLIYQAETQDAVKIAVLKAYNEALIVKESVSTSDIHVEKSNGPVIGLPPMDEDPALKVVAGGKKG